jgi:hypothetical protein
LSKSSWIEGWNIASMSWMERARVLTRLVVHSVLVLERLSHVRIIWMDREGMLICKMRMKGFFTVWSSCCKYDLRRSERSLNLIDLSLISLSQESLCLLSHALSHVLIFMNIKWHWRYLLWVHLLLILFHYKNFRFTLFFLIILKEM